VEPQLASLFHLSAGSPCRAAGNSAYATGTDIDGEPWASPPSIGCDEFWSGSATGALSVAIIASTAFTVPGSNVTFQAAIQGRASRSIWDFGDGTTLTNQPYVSRPWPVAGDYTVTLRGYNDDYPEGVATNVSVHVIREHYVSLDSTSPTWPYWSWQTAATNIQHAVDAAASGAVVWVSNGVYQTGARAVGTITNRVVVAKPVAVRSVNGPQVTVIWGSTYWARCAYLTNGALLAGFTLTNGTASGAAGGGASCGSVSDVLSNCVIVKNAASFGGGVAGGTLYNCTFKTNSASYGGGASGSTLNNCTLAANSSSYSGGGAYNCRLNNCLVLSNTASTDGGGAYGEPVANMSSLNNCTVVGNRAVSGSGGGTYAAALTNCIVYYNSAPSGSNNSLGGLICCCTTPKPSYGAGNITNAPLFVDLAQSNLRLQCNSPCINAGNNASFTNTLDLDGNPRIGGGTVDIGAYECQSPALLDYYTWLQSYGLSTAASDIYADSDGDRLDNWQEWLAGTNPTNAASLLRLQSPAVALPGLVLRWTSDTNHTYFLQRATNLAAPLSFSPLRTNVTGLPGTTVYTDTTAPFLPAALYRVGADTTNDSSPLNLQPPAIFPGRATLTWSSVTNRSYAVERSTNLGAPPAFSVLRSNLRGQPGTTSFTDTNPVTGTPCFYRIRVEP
jgi:hypothetical protein